MTRDILPIFEENMPREAGQALSAPFLRREEFMIALESGEPDLDPEELVAIGAMYMGRPIPAGIPVDFATVPDPNQRFGLHAANQAYRRAYYEQVTPFQMAFAMFAQVLPVEAMAAYSREALETVQGQDLRTVSAVAVLGTPEQPTAKLLVPREIGSKVALRTREKLLKARQTNAGQLMMAMMSPETRQRIMTQDPLIHNFGVLIAAGMMPLAEEVSEKQNAGD